MRKVTVLSGVTKTTDYIAGIEYDNSTTAIGFIQTEEGKAVPNGTINYDYYYYLGDNLGNTRLTFDTKTGAAVTLQQDDYYPFGLEINRSVTSPKNEYLYNKKELQEELGLYDYKHRFYDPVIGRFTSVDSLADNFPFMTCYQYASNEPVSKVDLDGLEAVSMGNPMATIAEGFREYFQAVGNDIDSFFASSSTSTNTNISTATINTGIGSATVSTSLNVTNTTTFGTGLGDIFNMNSANTPMGPLFKITNTTDKSVQTKVEGTTTIRGVEVKTSNTTNVSNNKVSNTTEVSAGQTIKVGKTTTVGVAAFVSASRTSANGKTSKENVVGVKAEVNSTVGNTTVTHKVAVGIKTN